MAGSLTYLPIATFILLPSTFLISYIIAISEDHVNPILPNISETGNKPPESCVFSMLLNISVALLAFIVYIRTKQITEFTRSTGLKDKVHYIYTINTISTSLGYITCLGLELIANFQEDNVRIVHDIGVLVSFWSGVFYAAVQTLISYWMSPQMHPFGFVALRIALLLISFVAVVVNQITSGLAGGYFQVHPASYTGNWTRSDPNWDLHVTSSITEWTLMLFFAFYILSFTFDFKRITLYTPELIMHDEPYNRQINISSRNGMTTN